MIGVINPKFSAQKSANFVLAASHDLRFVIVIVARVTKFTAGAFDKRNQKAIGYCLQNRMADGHIMNVA